ncbi:MAG: ABC transporter permease [Ktedonobacteraceae bacterium]|nr:ABC transporter permease [Ktedonobacteraceae bacterium]
MSTTVTSPTHLEAVSVAAPSPKNRAFIILNAFGYMLRRDIIVTVREFMPFFMQVLVQPFSLLFIFGKVLPEVGVTQQLYSASFLPGVIALNIVLVSIQGITVSLMLDLSTSREIDDRLLAPVPVSMVALEKVVFAALRGMVAGAVTFPLAYLILGSGYHVNTGAIFALIGIMILAAFASAALGLVIGTVLSADKIYLLFTLIFSALLYTGCVYYSWNTLSSIKVFQILTLFNPLTYASEGLRYAMVPPVNGHPFPTLAIGWVLLGLSATFVIFLFLGIRTFHKRVIS